MPYSYKRHVGELTQVLGLTEADMRKPVANLSGGMKRKLEIVRSLMHRPKILFLDEPTSGLDPKSRRDLWQYLHSFRHKDHTTIFLTTHYLEEAEGADQVCIINLGKIVALGSPGQIKKKFASAQQSLEEAYLNIIQQD